MPVNAFGGNEARDGRLRFSNIGTCALLCEAPAPLSLEWQQRLWNLAICARAIAHVREVVPGMNNLMVVFDPEQLPAELLERKIETLWPECGASARRGKIIELSVVYGGEHGKDLDEVATRSGLSALEVIKRHAAGNYTVFFLGAYPGLGFLGGLPPELSTPRRSIPRLKVVAGSVGIGGAQTAVMPATAPSGWNFIGHTDRTLFDVTATPPTLLAPGDQVRFRVDRIEI